MDVTLSDLRKENPKAKANILSYITFFYTIPLLRRGFKKGLQEEDIYNVAPKFQSEKLGKIAEREWNLEKQKRYPSVIRFFIKCFWKEYVAISLFQTIVQILISSLEPNAIGKFVSYFQQNQQNMSFKQACFYGFLIILLNYGNCLLMYNINMLIIEVAIKVKTCCSLLIYQKLFKLNQTTLSNTKIGQIVTMLTKDLFIIEKAIQHSNMVFIGFIKVFVLLFWIYNKMGVSVSVALGCLFMFLLLERLLASLVFKYRKQSNNKTQERTLLEQETLTAINVIKSNVWEKIFVKRLLHIRNNEMEVIKKLMICKATFFALGDTTFHYSIFFVIMFYLWNTNQISAQIVFFVISCYQHVRFWLTKDTAMGIFFISSVISSIKSISNFLLLEQIEELSSAKQVPIHKGYPTISLVNVSMKSNNKISLENISFNINKGLFVITGPIGSGKTLLLKVILGEVKLFKGSVKVTGSISYASQKPWLFPSSIKQNIIFGQSFNEMRYKKIIEICCLELDLNGMDNGDETIVIDHGNNLSEGQKARISLARALYKESDIYLIDDVMAGLDSIVTSFIYKNCIHNFLRDKICILITQNLKYLKENCVIFNVGNNETTLKAKIFSNPTAIDTRVEENSNHIDEDKTFESPKESDALLPNKFKKNIYLEQNKIGKLGWGVYKSYLNFFGIKYGLLYVLIWFCLYQLVDSATIKIIGNWIYCREKHFKSKNTTNSVRDENLKYKIDVLSILYMTCLIAIPIFEIIRLLTYFYGTCKASKNIYKSMVTSVLHCHIDFMNKNFLGNIINRFSKDIFTIDEILSARSFTIITFIFQILGVVIVISMTNAYFIILLIVFVTIFITISLCYVPTARSLKRMECSTLGPIISYMSTTLEGLITIKVNGAETILKRNFEKFQNHYTSVYHMMQCAQIAYCFFLETISNVLVFLVIIYFLFVNPGSSSGIVGTTLNQTLFLTGLLGAGFLSLMETEQLFTSVERVLEYIDIETENLTGTFLEMWPKKGCIDFNNVSLKYNSSHRYTLKNLNININSGAKICIIGRTGAGKTSMISALLRLHDIKGNIFIDDVDINTVSLNQLRKSITYISQDPILFTGTIRSNIDPMNEHSDSEIWQALVKVKLHENIKCLDQETLYYDNNFCAGHKQLLCLARALLNRNKIVILDEPTSNLDFSFECILKDCISSYFKDCTVIIITHRLSLLNFFDKLFVIENGSLLENGAPDILLDNKISKCFNMVAQAGI